MMVADQWRKRVNSTNIVGCNSREQHRAKKRNSGLQQYDSNMKSYISLEWDGNHKRVVAKREQVGISWRDLRPYSSSKGHNVVADVFTVPREIYDLENLEDVLSYEVWNTHLSEDERGHLMQYLPTGSGAEQILQALLSGDNFHFGSPFLNWGASLCSGELHPDVVLQQEQCVNTEKKTYYAELHKYHNDMIGCLKKLKDRFESCRDPEKEIVQKIRRSRYEADKKLSTSANDSKFHVLEDNVTATSESGSWVAEEKTCSSDNQNSSVMKGEYQNRVRKKGFKENGRSPLTVSDDMLNVGAKSRKGDKLHKQNIHSNDGAKYMSYVKISKKQHDIVKSMKQSGKSIQSRSLNRVLGNIDSFNVQPYRVFVEEEQKKLYEHWLQVATKALPAAYENWRELQRLRQQMTKSLELDLKNRSKILIEEVPDDGNKSHKTDLQDQIENGISDHVSTPADEAKSISGSPLKQFTPEDDAKSISGSPLKQSTPEDDDKSMSGSLQKQSTPEDDDKSMSGSLQKQSTLEDDDKSMSGSLQKQSSLEDDDKSMSGSPQNQSQQQFSGGDELNPMDIDLGENVITKSDHASSNASDYSENADTADVAVSKGVNLSCSRDVWPEGNMSHSYYDSNTSHEFTSDGGMSLAHQQVNEEQRMHLINLESEMPAGETGKDMVQRQSEDASFRQSSDGSFGSYTNQGRNELFQSLFKSPDGLTYHHEQKQNGLDFQSPNNIVMEEGHFPRHFQEQRHPVLSVEQRHPMLPVEQRHPMLPVEQRHPMLPVEQRHPMLPVEQRHPMVPVEQRHPSLTMEQRHVSLSMEQQHASLPMEQRHLSLPMEQRHLSLPMEQRHPSLPMEQLQKRANQVYAQQNISENVYSDGGRFLIPRQEPSTPVNMQHWSVNSVRMQPPIQSHLSGVQLLSQNWFSGEHNHVRGGWTGSDSASVPSQSIGSGSNGDQSLYSVLSHCNQLRPSSPYHSVVSTEQFLSSRNYGMMGGVGPSMSNVLPQSTHSLDYMSGREAAASLMPDDMGWMGLPHQNSSLHDPMGKPYLRSWNQ